MLKPAILSIVEIRFTDTVEMAKQKRRAYGSELARYQFDFGLRQRKSRMCYL